MSTTADESTKLKVTDLVREHKLSKVLNIDYFNDMQSIVAPDIYESDLNMVVSAPTGSGKTIVMELAILREASIAANPSDVRIIYVAPNKALCQQKVAEWTRVYGSLNMNVVEITGDIDNSKCMQHLAKSSIIVTTPEKWDSITRSWRQHVFLLGRINLLLLDEVQHLAEDRGATLETIVVRMRTLNNAYLAKLNAGAESRRMRIIAISATLPNIQDIGEWLRCEKKAVHCFDNTFRPLPLTVKTISYGSGANSFLFERSLDRHVSGLIQQFSQGKQTLIFCSSKKGTETLAGALVGQIGYHQYSSRRQRSGGAEATTSEQQLQDPKLAGLLRGGVAYHHGGVPADDRLFVEQEYLRGAVQVLVATSTLAYGVNLPAHLVIIKGTNQWRGGSVGYEKLSKSTVIQMVGRAGRVGFDTSGVAVIMTTTEDRAHYDMDAMEMETVESTLPAILIEVLCAEITQTVISSVAEAAAWIKSTFYYTRLKKNPRAYGLGKAKNLKELEQMLLEQCTSALQKLVDATIIAISCPDSDTSTAMAVTDGASAAPSASASASAGAPPAPTGTSAPTPRNPAAGPGRVIPGALLTANTEAFIMTRNMIKFRTMQLLMQLPRDCTMQKFLECLSKAEELHKPLRRDDKKVLNGLNNTVGMIRYNNKSASADGRATTANKIKLVQESWHKSYILVQAAVARNAISDFSLRIEQGEIVDGLVRMLQSLKQYCIAKTEHSASTGGTKKNDNSGGKLLVLCRLLLRALNHRSWDEHQVNTGGILSHCVAASGGMAALAASTKNHLYRTLGIRNASDIMRVFGGGPGIARAQGRDQLDGDGAAIARIQGLAHCSISEAGTLHRFVEFCRKYALTVVATIEPSNNSAARGGKVSVRFGIRSLGEAPTGVSTVPGMTVPTYALIAYSIPTQALLCHRDIPPGTTTASRLDYCVPYETRNASIFSHYNNDKVELLLRDIQVCLVCTNMNGFDHNITPSLIDTNATTYNYIPREVEPANGDQRQQQPPVQGTPSAKRSKKQKTSATAATAVQVQVTPAVAQPPLHGQPPPSAEENGGTFLNYFSLRHGTLPGPAVTAAASSSFLLANAPPNCYAPQEAQSFAQRWPARKVGPSVATATPGRDDFLQFSEDEEDDGAEDDEEEEAVGASELPGSAITPRSSNSKSVSFASPATAVQVTPRGLTSASQFEASSSNPPTRAPVGGTAHVDRTGFGSAPAHLSQIRSKAQEMNLDIICPIRRIRPRSIAPGGGYPAASTFAAAVEAPLPTLYAPDINSLARSTELLRNKASEGSIALTTSLRAPGALSSPNDARYEQRMPGPDRTAAAAATAGFFLNSHNTDTIAHAGSFFATEGCPPQDFATQEQTTDRSVCFAPWQARVNAPHPVAQVQSSARQQQCKQLAPSAAAAPAYITPPGQSFARSTSDHAVQQCPSEGPADRRRMEQVAQEKIVKVRAAIEEASMASSAPKTALSFDDLFF